ncbi:MAG: protein kinase [Pseudomonadota bacterium]|nr:protein kinase [Pseudomonadota bacterium]
MSPLQFSGLPKGRALEQTSPHAGQRTLKRIQHMFGVGFSRLRSGMSSGMKSASLGNALGRIDNQQAIQIDFSSPIAGTHLINWSSPVSQKQLKQTVEGYVQHAWYSCFKAGLQPSLSLRHQIEQQLSSFLKNNQHLHQSSPQALDRFVAQACRKIQPDYCISDTDGGYFKAYKKEKGNKKRLDASQIRTTNGKVYELLKNTNINQAQFINDKLNLPMIKRAGVNFIGKGGYGSVVFGRDVDTGDIVAIKKMRNKDAAQTELQGLELVGHHKGLLEELGHTHACQLKGKKREDHYYIATPLFELGSGVNIMRELEIMKIKNPATAKATLRVIAWEYTKAVAELHKAGIIHRDIKPDNYFHSAIFGIVLGDFGFVRSLKDETPLGTKGTDLYWPPEITTKNYGTDQYVGKKYDARKHDSFSLGMTLLELKLNTLPLEAECAHLTIQGKPIVLRFDGNICQGLIPRDVDLDKLKYDTLDEIIAGLIIRNRDKRLLPEEILSQPFFHGLS